MFLREESVATVIGSHTGPGHLVDAAPHSSHSTSTMRSPRDWQAMNAFVAEKQIRPTVSAVFSLEQASEAFGLMERGEQFGKIVVRISE